MKRATAISLTLLTCSVLANDVCSLKRANADKVVRLKNVPGYFFKVHPSGDYVTFIEGEHNSLVDMNTGKEFKTAGTIDPVWSPDGKFMTHPDQYGMKFFKGDDILKATLEGKPEEVKGVPTYLGGVYQSVGKVGDTYRVISDANGVSIVDYKFDSEPEQLNYPSRPCSNFNEMPTDLPMISKDGKYLSVYDKAANSTKIFKLEGKGCSLALDLGYGTGKVSFNADSSKIAFHVDQFAEFENGYFSGVTKDKVKNVVVLDLEKTSDGKLVPQKWALASNNIKPGNGGYYPDFDAAGNLFYMEDLDNNFQLVKTSLANLEFRPMESGLFKKPDCTDCKAKEIPTPTDVLAQMWSNICSQESALPKEFILALDGNACREMVEKFWVSSLNVKKESLLSTCPGTMGHAPVEVNQWDPNRKAKTEEIIQGKCLSCHKTSKSKEVEIPVKVWKTPSYYEIEAVTDVHKTEAIKLDSLTPATAAAMLNAITKGTMPKKEPLREEEKKEVSEYLRRKMLEGEIKTQIPEFNTVMRFSDEYLEYAREKVRAENPNANPEQLQFLDLYSNCMAGQKNCNEFFELYRPALAETAKGLPESKREKFVEDGIMEMRCNNLVEVTPLQCQRWYINK